MKRVLSLFLAALMAISLAACQNSEQADGTTGTTSATNATDATSGETIPDTTVPEETQPGPKVLYCCIEEKTTYSDGTGPVVIRTFDEKGNKLTENDTFADGSPKFNVTFTYDEQGNVLTEKSIYGLDGTGFLSTNTYDSNGQLIRNDYVGIGGEKLNNVTEYTYDSTGKLTKENVTETSGTKLEYTYTYDSAGNLLRRDRKVINSDGILAQENYELYTYDSNGNKLKWCDELGFKTEWTYDDRGNMLSEMQYDSDGFAMVGTVYTYDAQNRILTETWCKGDILEGSETYEYEYDSAGNRIYRYRYMFGDSKEGLTPNVKYTYDAAGNLITEEASGKLKEYKYIAIELPKE